VHIRKYADDDLTAIISPSDDIHTGKGGKKLTIQEVADLHENGTDHFPARPLWGFTAKSEELRREIEKAIND
jgi:hypothetical protein